MADKTKTRDTEALLANIKAHANSELRRLQACHGPAAEKVEAQPRKRPLEAVNSNPDTPQPSKKARVDSVWSDEVAMLNSGKEAVRSADPDMRPPSKTAEEPSQSAQVDAGELDEVSTLNPEQESIMARPLGVEMINIEAGSPGYDPSSLELTFGNPSDPLAPCLFNKPSTTYVFTELDKVSTELYLKQLAEDLRRDDSLEACYDNSAGLELSVQPGPALEMGRHVCATGRCFCNLGDLSSDVRGIQ